MDLNRRRIIINADDFGLTDGVNQAILDLARKGHITSTSVMINHLMHQQLEVPQDLRQIVGLGIHLNLTSGIPVLPIEDVSTLVDADGNFRSANFFFENTTTYNMLQIEKEWRAQIISFVIKFGRPDHLNSHDHVHLIPRLFKLFVAIAGELQIPIRLPIPLDLIPEVEEMGDFLGLGSRITRHMLDDDVKMVQYTGVRFPDYFAENFLQVISNKPTLQQKVIDNLPLGTTELMCHPAYVDANLRKASRYIDERDRERIALERRGFFKLLSQSEIELVRFNQI